MSTLSTILDPRYPMATRERARRIYDEHILLPLSYKLPRRLVMWCAVRVINEAWADDGEVALPDLLALDALERWGVE